MPKTKRDLDWNEIDTSTLPAKAKAAYSKYTEARKEAATYREHFESVLTPVLEKAGIISDGMVPRFSYNFGKLSVAEDTPTAKRASSTAIRLK